MNIKAIGMSATLLTSVVFSSVWAIDPNIKEGHYILSALVGTPSVEMIYTGKEQMLVYDRILQAVRKDLGALTPRQRDALVGYLVSQVKTKKTGNAKEAYERAANTMIEKIRILEVRGEEPKSQGRKALKRQSSLRSLLENPTYEEYDESHFDWRNGGKDNRRSEYFTHNGERHRIPDGVTAQEYKEHLRKALDRESSQELVPQSGSKSVQENLAAESSNPLVNLFLALNLVDEGHIKLEKMISELLEGRIVTVSHNDFSEIKGRSRLTKRKTAANEMLDGALVSAPLTTLEGPDYENVKGTFERWRGDVLKTGWILDQIRMAFQKNHTELPEWLSFENVFEAQGGVPLKRYFQVLEELNRNPHDRAVKHFFVANFMDSNEVFPTLWKSYLNTPEGREGLRAILSQAKRFDLPCLKLDISENPPIFVERGELIHLKKGNVGFHQITADRD
jgi:hypothetical protein